MSARTEISQESRRKDSMFNTEGSHMYFIKHGKVEYKEHRKICLGWEQALILFRKKLNKSSLLVSYRVSHTEEGRVLAQLS